MGYRARRLAIDRSIPLVTNVKNAKLFVEALAVHRRQGNEFHLLPVDAKTSHVTCSFPGLVQLQAVVPALTKDAVAGRIRRLLATADKRAEELGIPGTDHGVDEDHLPSSPDAGR